MTNDVFLEMMNIELTTKCPLRCPQCYCTLEGGKDIELLTAIKYIVEAKSLGLKEVMLSGGETLCYPHLEELVKAVADIGIKTNIAISGYNFTEDVLDKLINAGLSGIFISLNGSTKEIDSITRDGYKLAMSALNVLKDNVFRNTTINWVMHSSNADDFLNIISIAEEYNIFRVTVMAVKPNSNREINTVPSKEQMLKVANQIKNYNGKVIIEIEACFSPMLALVRDTKLFGNFNRGKYKGCGAGIWGMSISVEGKFSPCRHIDYYEQWNSIQEYWNKSNMLDELRKIDKEKKEPCNNCRFTEYCRHCMAINYKLNGSVYIGNKLCNIHR